MYSACSSIHAFSAVPASHLFFFLCFGGVRLPARTLDNLHPTFLYCRWCDYTSPSIQTVLVGHLARAAHAGCLFLSAAPALYMAPLYMVGLCALFLCLLLPFHAPMLYTACLIDIQPACFHAHALLPGLTFLLLPDGGEPRAAHLQLAHPTAACWVDSGDSMIPFHTRAFRTGTFKFCLVFFILIQTFTACLLVFCFIPATHAHTQLPTAFPYTAIHMPSLFIFRCVCCDCYSTPAQTPSLIGWDFFWWWSPLMKASDLLFLPFTIQWDGDVVCF